MKKIDDYKNEKGEIDASSIKQIIPYDYPFLMIDRVLSIDEKKIVAIKNVSFNENYFRGHFVNFPIFPGALCVEGMGQAATLLLRYNTENHHEKDCLAYKIKDAKFSEPIFPGSVVRYEAVLIGKDDRGGLFQTKAFGNDSIVAEATLTIALVDKKTWRGKYSSLYK